MDRLFGNTVGVAKLAVLVLALGIALIEILLFDNSRRHADYLDRYRSAREGSNIAALRRTGPPSSSEAPWEWSARVDRAKASALRERIAGDPSFPSKPKPLDRGSLYLGLAAFMAVLGAAVLGIRLLPICTGLRE